MRILALDLGTQLGYAYGDLETKSILKCGTKTLATPKEIRLSGQTRMDRRLDLRAPVMHRWLQGFFLLDPFDWIVFEDVQFAKSLQQAQLWSTWRAVVWLFAATNQVQVECCPVGTLKKFASGHGGASKGQMSAALSGPFVKINNEIHFGGNKVDDNAVDAAHLLKWAQTILANIKKHDNL
jgi:Holliday junction resolvasome RuvABC endonuclease subunit